MKRRIDTVKIFLVLVWLCACSDDFLDREPIIGQSESNFYRTEEDAVAAINAAYAALQFEMTPAGHFRWFWGDIMSDDSEKGGEGDNDQFLLGQLEKFQGPVNTDFLQSEWEANYEGIYRANKVLEYVPAIEMNQKKKNQILGEAYFIRAWFHYNLTTLFGYVPLVDKVLSPTEYGQPQSNPDELLDFVEGDLNLAIDFLPERSTYPDSELGRITKGAARSLLAKTYAYRQKWSAVETQLDALVQSGEYTLDPFYGRIFTEAGENGSGSIFEIQYMNASGGNWGRNNANEGTFSNVFQRARGQFEGYGFNIPTEDLVSTFIYSDGHEDARLKYTVFRVGDQMGDRGTFTKDAAGNQPHDYYTKKCFNNKSEEAPFGDPNPNGGTNDRVIRLADMLLLLAEAKYHLGKPGEALSLVNQVRSRAQEEEISSSGEALLKDIYRERRIELAMEGHRFIDLVRTNRAGSVLGHLGFKEGIHEFLPIPEYEIIKSNGLYVQNKGY